MDILILGAGVAGAAAAIALRQRGHAVRVFERRALAGGLGAGVVLWPNASFVLSELGLLSQVAAAGGTPPGMCRMDQCGRLLMRLDIGGLDRAMGYASHALLRRDLQAILLAEMARLGVQLHDGATAVALRAVGDGTAAVRFDDGRIERADLIVGADGRMDSLARRYVHCAEVAAPRYQGFVNWVASVEAPVDLVDDLSVLDFWGVGERFGIVPVGRRKLYWAGAQAAAAPGACGGGDFKAALAEQFAGWPEPVGRVIAHTEAGAIRRIPIYDLEPVARWHRDNVLLIGDAAHASLPTSGQGACQALEDAWHLARCLEPGGDLSLALAGFTARRADKTGAITHGGRQLARSLFQLDRAGSQARNAQARAADPAQAVAAMAQGWGAGLELGL
ncbi:MULTISPECIES: FAD-dependent monooxygenase [unclassified Janthinobacterium]|uniref:FAD-dependent monooxygenase n=1 Tax=unclassified Janthinobacterium TaxID=2610881 RepID=UPI00034A6298|nr:MULTISPECIES: FAD-dependent monooxygenase [unclassified Janthinobacterium]MEC5159523.1 FAD-dependent urate hydroxylase [Janthinobacterium sp. CG_S6]